MKPQRLAEMRPKQAKRALPLRLDVTRCVLLAFALTLGSLALSACGGAITAAAPAEQTITVAGQADMIPLAREMADSFAKGRPSLHIATTITTSAGALTRLGLDDMTVAVISQRPSGNQLRWTQTEIARQPISIIVHPDNPIKNLSFDDLASIYSGRSSDWSQVGGLPMPIMVLSREPAAPLRQRLDAALIGSDGKLTPNALLLPSDEAMVVTVARRGEAIGYMTGSGSLSSVKTLTIEGEHPATLARGRAYPLWQSIILATSAQPPAQMTAFLAYVKSRQGQRIVALWGYGQGADTQ